MVGSFESILKKASIFRQKDVLSPHYLPETLPHREKEIEIVMRLVSPALKGSRTQNLFVYGKTGTGKTSSVKHVMELFGKEGTKSHMLYMNCRIYNSRYRVLQHVVKEFMPAFDKPGYGVSFLYEKILDWIETEGKVLLLVLDEIDMVHDLDDLIYTLIRSNDDLKHGHLSIIGISNKLNFKEALSTRSRSTLCETELVFPPYNSPQLQAILKQRIGEGFAEGAVEEDAVALAAAIAAQETGDARYALRLMLRAGELADEAGAKSVTGREVEEARKSVDENVAIDAVCTLPEHQQLVLYAVASLAQGGGKYSKLADGGDGFLLSGEVYEQYSTACRKFGKEARSARWFREYLNELEMLGLISMIASGKGIRGHTRLVKMAYVPEKIMKILERSLLPMEKD
ncbi:MAG: AAA family ATPase [Candidatus Burarchaeum sp.]|nr:AAA family ATPase [Candidatus Burarchaeum sp.]MDO8339799.1 AAA family ATPase [Candidatus Burarchaeum sp.]